MARREVGVVIKTGPAGNEMFVVVEIICHAPMTEDVARRALERSGLSDADVECRILLARTS